MGSDCSVSIIEICGVDMRVAVLGFICCLVGVTLWCILGYTLEKYGVSNMWFMWAGYWFYPVFNYINDTIMWHK